MRTPFPRDRSPGPAPWPTASERPTVSQTLGNASRANLVEDGRPAVFAEAGIARLRPVSTGEYASAAVLTAIRQERADRRTRLHSRWWYPLVVLVVVLCCVWGSLKADQLVAETLIWPTSGAQFVEAGPRPEDPSAIGGPMMIVVGGLNRKSGSGVAGALMDSLSTEHTRVFSLVYGSGINDRDILDKFDALMTQTQPSEVGFFGSSMGGDVVLALASHAQTVRDQYRENLLAGLAVTGSGSAGRAPVARPAAGSDSAAGNTTEGNTTEGNAAEGNAASGTTTDEKAAEGNAASGNTTEGNAAARKTGAGNTGAGNTAAGAGTWRPAVATELAPSHPTPDSGTTADLPAPQPPPRLGTIYLDCSPLGADDVRDSSRTQADAITGLTEALDTDGGVAVRLTAEVLAQRDEWSSGEFPFLQVRWDEFRFKFDQVWREKIGAPGISTGLVKDQYGVIRRTNIDDIVTTLSPGTRIVYFLPENRHDDRTIRVEQVEQTLRRLAPDHGLDLRIVPIPGGHHASAESNPQIYRSAIDAINRRGT